ncbi:MAG: dipeptidase [Bacteroidetes bacterium HGW-Bacteroidetes-6]|jgi:dipeptidase|nr:MAG: dipeptidase [Bacteroidetes bacterium HGW-Bacteroidetes-6]
MLRITIILLFLSIAPAFACTNLIVTKSASKDGSVMITYAADSHRRYGYLFYHPAADHKPGDMVDLIHYENGKWLGQIPEVAHTYNVVGLMNEHQVAIGETTFGGLDSLQNQPGALPDYGSLMKLALQRAKTAREAIQVIAELVEKYGYASSGESFSISDKNEAWIMEIIGKGKYEKGAVWVAMRIPDGYVSGHANQARITTFAFQKKNDWSNLKQEVYHSPDVISFAKAHGFYKGTDATFSFSDVYNPINFGGARFCDARVWSFFRSINSEIRNNISYTNYALGNIVYGSTFADGTANPNSFASNRLPLWIKADAPIDIQQVMAAMRNHFEDTPLDMRDGIGAGPWHCPYRWRPMTFEIDSVNYIHERAIATQQTGYSFVAQSRSWLDDLVGGIFWFGVDDADACVYAPMYTSISKIPSSYAFETGSMIEWNDSSAFWAFNMVTNWCYTRYDLIHPEVEKYQSELENGFLKKVSEIDAAAVELLKTDRSKAQQYLTNYSVTTGNQLVQDWKAFFQYLFMKYMDGNMKESADRKLLDNGNDKGIPKKVTHPGYSEEWLRLMMMNTGFRYLAPEGEH